jgi:hypothetical protein
MAAALAVAWACHWLCRCCVLLSKNMHGGSLHDIVVPPQIWGFCQQAP